MGLHYKSFRFLDTLHHQKLKTPCALGKAIIGVNDCLLSIRVPGHICPLRRSFQPHLEKYSLGPWCLVGIQCPSSEALGPRMGQEVCAIHPVCQFHIVRRFSEALRITMGGRKAFVGLIHTRKGQDSEGK